MWLKMFVGNSNAWARAGSRYSDAAILTIGCVALRGTVLLSLGIFFGCLDHFQLLQQYKLPRARVIPPSKQLLRRAYIETVLTHLIVQPLALYFIGAPWCRGWFFSIMAGPKFFAFDSHLFAQPQHLTLELFLKQRGWKHPCKSF